MPPTLGPARPRPSARVVVLVFGLILAALLVTAPAATATPALPVRVLPVRAQPIPTPPPEPGAIPEPCAGQGCLPQPPPPLPRSPVEDAGLPGGGAGAECGITNIGGCVSNAIDEFFRGLVADALNPLLDLLSATLLTTPAPESLPRIGQLWSRSWEILLACYGLLVMAAGVLLMAYESLQARYSVKELAPRLVVGFLAGALSLFLSGKAVAVANALAAAVMGGGLEAATAGQTVKNMVFASLSSGGIFILFLGVFLVAGLVVLLITYLVRVALTLILIAGAPLALMCHALPQTEPVAFWWWKAFAGCLAIQIAQSLALITGLRVLLAPGGFTPFVTSSGLVNLLVALALLYILIKIPFWILGSLRVGGGRRSLVGTAARAYVIGTALGWIGGRRGGPRRPPPPPPGGGPGPTRPHGGGGGPRGGGSGGPRGGGPIDSPTTPTQASPANTSSPQRRREHANPSAAAAGPMSGGRRPPAARSVARPTTGRAAPSRAAGPQWVAGAPRHGTRPVWAAGPRPHRPAPDRSPRAPRPPSPARPAPPPPRTPPPVRLPPDLPTRVRPGAPQPTVARPPRPGGRR